MSASRYSDKAAIRAPGLNIVLSGTYSSQNKGDAAMQFTAAEELERRGARVTILAPFAESDASFYQPLPVVQCERRRIPSEILRLLATQLLPTGLGRNFSRANRAVCGADLVVDLSGDMITEDYGAHVAISHYLPMLRAIALDRPFMMCAQSIGPFAITKPLARYILGRAEIVTVRDKLSLDYLHEMGVCTERLHQTADLAFLLPKEQAPSSARRVSALGLNPAKPFIGVSVSRLVAEKYDSQFRASGAFVRMMAASIGDFAERHGLQILFVPHVTGPTRSKDDRVISREVAELLSPKLKAAVIDDDLGPKEIKGIIAMATIFVGTRMHANIAALSSNVPVLAIAYSHKTPGIMAACDVGEFSVDFGQLTKERLDRHLDEVHDRRNLIRETLMRTVPQQQQLAATNIDLIMEIAESHRK